MRKLLARVYDYSLDGLTATEGTEFLQFCRDLPDDPAEDASGSEFYAGADMHIMGRVAYQSMASYFPTATDDPNAECLNAARKVVFSARRSTSSAEAATVTSSSAVASASGVRSRGST
jgi:dihydrofolate reductase